MPIDKQQNIEAPDVRSNRRRPLYQKVTDTLGGLISKMNPGDYLPSEPVLARELGISRATLREAMRPFEQSGHIVRRQGIGTYVTMPPPTIESGLEVMESLATTAERMGLELEVSDFDTRERFPSAEEASQMGLTIDSPLLQVSRTIGTKGRPLAYLIDSVPRELLPLKWLENDFSGSVLDVLAEKYAQDLAYDRTEITALEADRRIAGIMGIQRGTAMLHLDTYLITTHGGAIDHALSYFLPGGFRFHVMRRMSSGF